MCVLNVHTNIHTFFWCDGRAYSSRQGKAFLCAPNSVCDVSFRSIIVINFFAAQVIKQLRKVAEDDKIIAVILKVDSPGGEATASDLVIRV